MTRQAWSFTMVMALAAGVATLAASQPQGERMNAMEQARAEIMEADRDFCSALKARDLAAFRGFVSDSARFYGSAVSVGRDRVAEAWGGFFEENRKAVLLWTPVDAAAASSADLGYTHGTFELQTTGDDGAVTSRYGQYVSIWRKEQDGRWRVVLDIGTPPGTEKLAEKR